MDKEKAEQKIDNKKTSEKKKQGRFLNYVIYFLLLIITVILLIFALGTITFLKHRQLCSFQAVIDSGRLVSTSEEVLCKNPLDTSQWGDMVSDIFWNDFRSGLVAPEEIRELGSSTTCYDQLNPICWASQLEGDLKQADGFTNLLIVGSDTHYEEIPGNTDTIMVASYDHNSGETILISFPRDLLINHTDLTGSYVTNRINTLFPIYETYQQNGRDTLNNAISQIIGKPIHYYAYFGFDTFLDIIDSLGGVTITLDEPFYDAFPCTEVPSNITCDRLYELGLGGYGKFEFPAGENHFDSFDALVYSRARQLSNDFERADRQQNLVQAIIKNILEKDMSLGEKFALYTGLFSQLSSQVDTNIQLSDISGMFKILDAFTGDITKIVVDPDLGGANQIVYSAGVDPVYYYIVKFNDYSYAQLQTLIDNIWDYLPYYTERPKIKIDVLPGSEHLNMKEIQEFLASGVPYAQFETKENSSIGSTGVRIYDMSGKATASLKDLPNRLPGALLFNAELEKISRSSFNEDILIVIGK